MIIDSLTHVTDDGNWFSTTFDASEERLLREMDEAEVDRAVVVALADFIDNEYVSQVCNRHPNRLIPGASINPGQYSDIAKAQAAMQELLKQDAYAVLKLHPRLNQYDPLDPSCLGMLEVIAEHKPEMPIWLDTFLYIRGCMLRKPPIDTIYELVNRYPMLNFVLLHGCGASILQLAEAIRGCPNTLLDISYTLNRYRGSSVDLDLTYLLKNFERRMTFGSDFPEVSIPQAIDDFQVISNGLPFQDMDYVLSRNLAQLLNV